MYIKYFRFLVAILFCAITSCSTVREKPRPATSTGKEAKREFRGAWIQTAFQGEYKDMTPARMKKDFIRKLNYLQGVAPAGEFDPMAFLIQECHKRNMEFHAWLNPYRASTAGNTRFADSHIYHKHPEWFVTYNKQILFDPGLPESRQFICRVVRDIVGRNTACEKDTARRKGTIGAGRT